MPEAISWSSFLQGLFFITVVYYAFIGGLFYRRELLALFAKRELAIEKPVDAALPSASLQANEQVDERLFSDVHELLQDLKLFWQRATGLNKPLLLEQLKQVFTRYQRLADSAFEPAINDQVRQEAEQYCSVQLEDDDLRLLWNK